MTYKEILEQYKKGELSKEQREKVEKEIEKQEAISEYLFDSEHIPEFSEMDVFGGADTTEKSDKDNDILRMIKKSIRRAFIKAGVTVGIVVLALVLLATTTLPHIVDAMYYDPSEVVGEVDGIETNRMSLDTSVYTELFTPGYYRTKVNVESEGFGKYDIHILQNFSVNGQFRDVYGMVDKGKLTLFSDGLFKTPTGNAFVSGNIQGVNSGFQGMGAAGDAQTAKQALEQLDEDGFYIAYVTLDKVMTYDEFAAWSKASDIIPDWCAICKKQDADAFAANDIIGFNYVSNGRVMGYDDEKYPYLNYCDMMETVDNLLEEAIPADVMETHVISMLRYMKDSEIFREMTGSVLTDNDLEVYADNVAEHGLNIYGFAIVEQRDTLIEISQNENVQYIYTSPLN